MSYYCETHHEIHSAESRGDVSADCRIGFWLRQPTPACERDLLSHSKEARLREGFALAFAAYE